MVESKKFIDDVFSSVANKYDLMNDLMSVGLHRLWKKSFIKKTDILPHSKVIDVASGTGDIAIKILRKYKDVAVTLCDRNLKMLNIARNKLINNGFVDTSIVCCDAEKLPFPDNYFDYYTIAFGIRNVSNIDTSLKEAFRVLKSGGKFTCLEFSHVKNRCLSTLYEAYSNNIIPFIGEKVTKDRAAYEYLVESIRNFPDAKNFCLIIENSGFKNPNYTLLSGGIAAIHVGYK